MLTYEKTRDGLHIKGVGFDITKTALSGQIFRYLETDGGFVIFSKDKRAVCINCKSADYEGAKGGFIDGESGGDKKSDCVFNQSAECGDKKSGGASFQNSDGGIICGENDNKCYENREKSENFIKIITKDGDYFIKYFDLNKNYDIIKDKYGSNAAVADAIEYSGGIRMLRQDCFETVISFIISANNNIPRIKAIIERLCKKSGRDMDGGLFNAFPEPFEMRDLSEEFYKSIGAGYRASYLYKTVRAINDGFDLNRVFGMPADEAQKYLMRLEGVGPKVADCILLFAYGKGGVFPVDTWIKKSAKELFGIDCGDIKKISRELVGLFGEDSGIIQQYIYYYMRSLKE
ncbi:MAG: hypothetical protein LBP62_04955 [Clostridiales bacterium]|jgi:N-glycosylase/DNA lyase|nr:hypothetical protein [Clostridiales bacterium]